MSKAKQPQHGWNVRPPQDEGSGGDHYFNSVPDTSRKAYAVCRLTFFPAGSKYFFEPGDEVQDILPADVLAQNIRDGNVSYTKPAG